VRLNTLIAELRSAVAPKMGAFFPIPLSASHTVTRFNGLVGVHVPNIAEWGEIATELLRGSSRETIPQTGGHGPEVLGSMCGLPFATPTGAPGEDWPTSLSSPLVLLAPILQGPYRLARTSDTTSIRRL
jgi:hypothetical protein